LAATDALSRVFQALADPTRRAIVARLRTGTATVSELAAPLPMSAPAVSQHLRVLEQAGLIERTARAQWRTIALRPVALTEAEQWIAEQRREWNERFDLLEARLAELQEDDDDRHHE
jgi:DNA-binding transcriptional ArsR family regulator